MLKKWTAIVLCLALVLGCALAEAGEMTGAWYLNTVVMDGLEMNPLSVGMDMTMTLNDGGEGSVLTQGIEIPAEWTLEGASLTVVVEGDPMTFVVSEDALTAETDGVTMIFTREAPDAPFVPAEPVKAQDVAAFDGTWMAVQVDLGGAILPIELFQAQQELPDPSVVIENGVVDKFGSGFPETGTLTDGELILPSLFTPEADPDNLMSTTITLLEDGMLRLTYARMTFYCVLTGAAPVAETDIIAA